jgi:hypothetical protein
MKRLFTGVIAWILIGCGAAPNEIVAPRKVPSASGAPSIARVTDLGDLGAIPDKGAMPRADTDGVFVVGELVLIEGSDFGKQPTVLIGGRPTSVEARTGNGSIIARIPPEVPTGKADVEVSHPGGRHALAIDIRRHGFAVQPGTDKVHVFTVDRRGVARPAGSIAVTGARDVAMTGDGQIALVAADAGKGKGARVAVIAVTAAGGPRLVRELRLAQAAAAKIACARSGPLGAVAGKGQVTLLDLRDPRNPAMHKPCAAPDSAAMELSPDGAWLAVLDARKNSLLPVDVSKPAAPRPGAVVTVLPEALVPLVRDLAFSPAGDEIWIVSGDNAEAMRAGAHPTQLITIAVDRGVFTVKDKADLSESGAPMAMAVSRRETIASGAAIGSREGRVAIILATVDRGLFAQQPGKPGEPGASAPELGQLGQLGQLVRTDLAGQAETLADDPGVITALVLSHDARQVVAMVARPGQGGARFGLLVVAPGAPGAGSAPSFVELGAGRLEDLALPGSVALSP